MPTNRSAVWREQVARRLATAQQTVDAHRRGRTGSASARGCPLCTPQGCAQETWALSVMRRVYAVVASQPAPPMVSGEVVRG